MKLAIWASVTTKQEKNLKRAPLELRGISSLIWKYKQMRNSKDPGDAEGSVRHGWRDFVSRYIKLPCDPNLIGVGLFNAMECS